MNSISVIIPTFEHATSIPLALDSIFAQTRPPEEVIVVDDGSRDSTREALEPYLDRITYVYQQNQGAPNARNRGFKMSKGNLVIFWDADVVAQPRMLEKMETALNRTPDADWAYGSFWWGKRLFHGQPFSVEALKSQNYIHTSSLIRREAFLGFDETLKRFQDWDLWLTMTEHGRRGVFVNEVLYRVLIDPHRPSYSRWLPKFVYHLPWKQLRWSPRFIKSYQEALSVITRKHFL